MIKVILAALLLVLPTLARADDARPKHPSAVLLEQMARADQAAKAKQSVAAQKGSLSVTCSLCYTCGGTWPIFAGSFETTTARERTSKCASGPVDLDDTRPFLCCRR